MTLQEAVNEIKSMHNVYASHPLIKTDGVDGVKCAATRDALGYALRLLAQVDSGEEEK